MRLALNTLALVALAALAVLLWRLIAPITTPPFRDAQGRVRANSIAVIERWRINGSVQSVLIRGADVSNPILVFVHGGPGSSVTPVMRRLNRDLEQHFTVVYWDQRGAGQSYSLGDKPPADLSIATYVADLGEVVARVRARFGGRKALLVGHSWGTILTLAYARVHPEALSGLVNIGQVADVPRSEARSYVWALAEARRLGKAKAVAALEAIGPPPRAEGLIYTPRNWLQALGGSFRKPGTNMFTLAVIGAQASEANGRDIAALFLAGDYAQSIVSGEMSRYVVPPGPVPLAMPVFIVSGRYDQQSEASVAHEFFERIVAPAKAFKWFEACAHSPIFEEPAAFDAWMVDVVRPALAQ